jgi:catechol 2,3-dioxygenase-like lactoylglutathione lyase family enzyme
MPDPLQKIDAISLFVEDLQAAKAFYQEVFDVPVVYEDDTSAAMKFHNLIVNLLQAEEASILVEPGVVADRHAGSRFQLSIWVEDVDAVCRDLEKRGAQLLIGPVDRPWGMRVATFTDPAGHSWEVAQQLEG